MSDRWIELNMQNKRYGYHFRKRGYKNLDKIFSSSFNWILRRDIWIPDVNIILEKTHKSSLDMLDRNIGIMLK